MFLEDGKAGVNSYRDALFIVHKCATYLMLIPYQFLMGPMIRRSLVNIGRAAASLKYFINKMITEEAAALSGDESGTNVPIRHLVYVLLTRRQSPKRESGTTLKR